MIGLRQHAPTFWILLLLGEAFLFSHHTMLQVLAQEIPTNAHKSAYGNGWDCDRGFKQVGQACEKVAVPLNAHIDVYGHGWDCDRGFRQAGQGCEKVAIPLNAHIDVYGHGWDCDRGFKQAGQGCEKVAIPLNAHIDVYGHGWDCDSGFRRAGQGCEEVVIPPNAHIDVYGHGWDCDSGFRRAGQGCERVAIPLNAHIDVYGHSWDCDSGFRRVGQGCEKIAVPLNAHIDVYGHGWDCDRGFRKSNGACIPILQQANQSETSSAQQIMPSPISEERMPESSNEAQENIASSKTVIDNSVPEQIRSASNKSIAEGDVNHIKNARSAINDSNLPVKTAPKVTPITYPTSDRSATLVQASPVSNPEKKGQSPAKSNEDSTIAVLVFCGIVLFLLLFKFVVPKFRTTNPTATSPNSNPTISVSSEVDSIPPGAETSDILWQDQSEATRPRTRHVSNPTTAAVQFSETEVAESLCPVDARPLQPGQYILKCKTPGCQTSYHKDCWEFLQRENRSMCVSCGLSNGVRPATVSDTATDGQLYEIVHCPKCGSQNRISKWLPKSGFRCGKHSCRTMLFPGFDDNFAEEVIGLADVGRHVGRIVVFRGDVLEMRKTKAGAYLLKFESGRTNSVFKLYIPEISVPAFRSRGIKIENYLGSTLEIRGLVQRHPRWNLEIVATEPEAIREISGSGRYSMA